MTRDSDSALTLDQRTRYANTYSQGAVLISLHGNANANTAVRGIETYYMAPHLFTTQLTLMNDNDQKKVNFYTQELAKESEKLAHMLHKNLITTASNFQDVVDRKVKKQAGQVLFGQMPSVLIEFGFLSNPEECKLLKKDAYQEALATSVADGLREFFATSFA